LIDFASNVTSFSGLGKVVTLAVPRPTKHFKEIVQSANSSVYYPPTLNFGTFLIHSPAASEMYKLACTSSFMWINSRAIW
jgi:hypothetical protein